MQHQPVAAGVQVGATIGVIVTTYNHARYLSEALDSIRAQTLRPDEVVVVDDGSEDRPFEITARYPEVRLLRQDNAGLAAARNAGIRAARSDFLVFLDADDRLTPNAIAAGLAAFERAPQAGFVYGAHRRVDVAGRPLGKHRFDPVGEDAYADLLTGNFVAMHGATMYRRACMLELGGFDPNLRRCEDYDLYLRMARRYPVACHSELVAEYRIHGGNMSADLAKMRRAVTDVHRRQISVIAGDSRLAAAWRRGQRSWQDYYDGEMLSAARESWRRGRRSDAVRTATKLIVDAPYRVLRRIVAGALRRTGRAMKRRFPSWLGRRTTDDRPIPIGRVDFGDFSRVRPVSEDFGFERGLPVDRYYIERFLGRCSRDITGRVLEVGDNIYTRQFGRGGDLRSDILHVRPGNPQATIVGDLGKPNTLPSNSFDCVILTQTLHLIFHMSTALEQIYRSLKPGGVLLLTVPGITPIDRGEWSSSWYWSLTAASTRRLLTEVFGAGHVSVETHGNVFAATAFLQGVALEEVSVGKLDYHDAAFPVIVAARACKEGGQSAC